MKPTNEIKLINRLLKSYKDSTQANNQFEKVVKSTKWDEIYETSDKTTVYRKAYVELEVASLNPFDDIRPSLMVGMEPIIYF